MSRTYYMFKYIHMIGYNSLLNEQNELDNIMLLMAKKCLLELHEIISVVTGTYLV